MPTPIDAPLTGDIWHLSIDDLFGTLPGVPRLGGAGPFVINLSASTAPISVPKAGIAGSHPALLYQLQRIEDRRPRYRLRLGPFASEDEADAILKKVRDTYPGALTATAEADDLRAIEIIVAKSDALKQAQTPVALALPGPADLPLSLVADAVIPPTLPVSSQVVTARVGSGARAPTPTLAVAPTAAKQAVPILAVAPTAAKQPVPTLVAAARVAKQPVPTKSPLPANSKTSISSAIPVAAKSADRVTAKSEATAKPAVTVKPSVTAVAPRRIEPADSIDAHILDLETTQTVRALTAAELQDDEVLRWYVIQLSLSHEVFDPDAMPDLDIFNVYRLYSVASIDQGKIMHALRLGFFTEEIAAKAVASYLATYYDRPSIRRVSRAERERFANQRLEPRKDVGATGKHAAIEITDERYIRERRVPPAGGMQSGVAATSGKQTQGAKK